MRIESRTGRRPHLQDAFKEDWTYSGTDRRRCRVGGTRGDTCRSAHVRRQLVEGRRDTRDGNIGKLSPGISYEATKDAVLVETNDDDFAETWHLCERREGVPCHRLESAVELRAASGASCPCGYQGRKGGGVGWGSAHLASDGQQRFRTCHELLSSCGVNPSLQSSVSGLMRVPLDPPPMSKMPFVTAIVVKCETVVGLCRGVGFWTREYCPERSRQRVRMNKWWWWYRT